MKKIAIIGAGGFGREIKTLIDQINAVKPLYELIGFFDDSTSLKKINGVSVLGNINRLINDFSNQELCMAIH